MEGEFMRQNSRKTIYKNSKSIFILIIFCFFLIVAYGANASSWINPTKSPPLDNVAAPLNESTPFGGDPISDILNSNVIGTYNNLKIKIAPCADGQTLMWSMDLLATGQVVCGDPILSVGLLDVLNYNADAGAYGSVADPKGVIIGTTAGTWMNLGGAFTASWIHATSSGDNTIAGNLGVGTTTPNSKLEIYVNDTSNNQLKISQDSTGDAAIYYSLLGEYGWISGIDNSDYNSFKIGRGSPLGSNNDFVIRGTTIGNVKTANIGIGTANPGAKLEVVGQAMFGSSAEVVADGQNLLYGNMDTTSLGNLLLLQNESVDKFKVDKDGGVYASKEVSSTKFCLLGKTCISDWAETGGLGTYDSVTTIKYNGSQGGYKTANSRCGTGKHICTVEEVLYSINYDKTLPTNGVFWVTKGAPGAMAGLGDDCSGWKSAEPNAYGVVWFNDATKDYSDRFFLTPCDAPIAFMCCK